MMFIVANVIPRVLLAIVFAVFLFLLALKLCPRFQRYFFSIFFKVISRLIFDDFLPHKEGMFEKLREIVQANRGSTELTKVLEIGVGGGSNFSYYPSDISLTTLDPNNYFGEEMKENLKRLDPGVTVERHVLGVAEDMSVFPSNYFDVVVSTHVICTVTDIPKTLQEVQRLLKKGGKFLYMEHGSYPRGSLMRFLQILCKPIFKLIGGGCDFTRFPGEAIEAAGFHEVIQRDVLIQMSQPWIFRKIAADFYRPNVLGIATK